MPSKDKYTEPELREQVKEEIREGGKGGAPGQWSARKAQMTATEDKKRGGGYTMDKKEKEETDNKKQKESKQGKQYVENTSKAIEARKNASEKEDDDEVMYDVDDQTSHENQAQKNNDRQGIEAKDCSQHWENAAQSKDEHEQYRKFKSQEKTLGQEHSEEGEHTDSERGNSEGAEDQGESNIKRGRGANQSGPNKKHKKSGSKDQARGTAGDKTRVPEVGQKVQWKSLPGFVDGEVIEVVYEEKKVDGKSVKGSKEDPRIVLKSSSSGKIAIHKPEAVYFD